jgi:hypothetical protein
MKMTERIDRIVFWPVLAAIVVGLVLFAVNTVPDPNVTWDEAGQFWMSQGAGYGTAWNDADQGLIAGLEYGRAGNILDPIGFTSLLAGWVAMFGPEPTSLRTLPFLFFLGTVAASFFLGRSLMRLPRTIALVLPVAVLTSYVTSQWATEIRNYSMELLGIVIAVIAMMRYLQRPSWIRMAGLVAVLALFSIGSRYSFALAAATAMFTIVLFMWRTKQLSLYWSQIAAGLVVMAFTAGFLVWNVGLLRGDRVWSTYVDNSIRVESVTDFTAMRMLLQINFVYGWHKLTAVFLVAGLIAWLWTRRSDNAASLNLRRVNVLWIPAWVFVVLYEVLRALASQAGGPMWNAEHKHGVALISIAIISGFGTLVIVQACGRAWWQSRVSNGQRSLNGAVAIVGQAALWTGLVGLTWMSVSHFSEYRRDQIETIAQTVPTKVASAVASEEDIRWRVETLLYPSLRYLVFKSGVDLGNLSIDEAQPFSTYGHDLDKFLQAMKDTDLCDPSTTTAVLAAGSAEQNAGVFEEYARFIDSQGCNIEIVPLSSVESLVLVRKAPIA